MLTGENQMNNQIVLTYKQSLDVYKCKDIRIKRDGQVLYITNCGERIIDWTGNVYDYILVCDFQSDEE